MAEEVDRNDPNYDSGEERHALAYHSRKVEQIKAYKQAVLWPPPSPPLTRLGFCQPKHMSACIDTHPKQMSARKKEEEKSTP